MTTRIPATLHLRRLDHTGWSATVTAGHDGAVLVFTTGAGSFWDVATLALETLADWARVRGVELEVRHRFDETETYAAA